MKKENNGEREKESKQSPWSRERDQSHHHPLGERKSKRSRETI
jgi:hypothetical protein